ncbi:MAG: site-specific DNA-methyltransferase [bacterium]|nr:site-specific DNA-methyltransferase [bacterium]
MSQVDDRAIHLVVTSPPYWQLKDYGSANQIGFDDSYEEYINNLNRVWMECHRVLHDGCRLCINIGDQFARSVYYGRYKVIPIRTEITRFCETIGFDFMGSIIWQKVTTCNTTGGATVMGSFPYPRNGVVKIDYEFILLFKKHGEAPKPSAEMKELSKLTTEEWNLYFSGHWNFSGEKQDSHLAMFPEELPHRLIKMFSFAGETVLDPFLGSGTTSKAAMNLGRNSIGYEINPEYRSLMEAKLSEATGLTFAQDPGDSPARPLPYQFVDPLKLDKTADLKQVRFGSKLDSTDTGREELFRVKEILSATRLRLSNDAVIELLGVTTRPEQEAPAMQYLRETLKNEQLFIRHENVLAGEQRQSRVYLYLKNRTFINARLIKQGLADLDESYAGNNTALLKLSGQHVR